MKIEYEIFHLLLPSGAYRNLYAEPVKSGDVIIGAIEKSGRFWTATSFERTGDRHDNRTVWRFVSSYNFHRKLDAVRHIMEN